MAFSHVGWPRVSFCLGVLLLWLTVSSKGRGQRWRTFTIPDRWRMSIHFEHCHCRPCVLQAYSSPAQKLQGSCQRLALRALRSAIIIACTPRTPCLLHNPCSPCPKAASEPPLRSPSVHTHVQVRNPFEASIPLLYNSCLCRAVLPSNPLMADIFLFVSNPSSTKVPLPSRAHLLQHGASTSV